MKICYEVQSNGQATDLRFVSDGYIAAQGEVLINGDVLPDINTLHSLDYLKQKKIAEIKEKAGKEILLKYPYYRQMNINALQGYAQADKDAMWAVINEIRAKENNIGIQINACMTKEELEVIVW